MKDCQDPPNAFFLVGKKLWGRGMSSWQVPSAGHGHVNSAQDQFPEGVLGFMEQLKSPLSQQGTRGLLIAALWFCTRSVNHTNCFWKKSKSLFRWFQTGHGKMAVALEESQQIPWRHSEVLRCLHHKKQGAFQRGANGWFISGSFSTLPCWESPSTTSLLSALFGWLKFPSLQCSLGEYRLIPTRYYEVMKLRVWRDILKIWAPNPLINP